MKLVSTLASLLFALPALAAPTTYAPAPSSEATFEAVGKPSLLKIKGKGAVVGGNLEMDGNKPKGRFEVDLNAFNTGINLRDRHMKEKYLETAKYPKAVVEIDSLDLPAGWAPGKDAENVKFKGKLTLKDVTKPIEGLAKISGASMATEAKFTINLQEFPVGVPSYMGVTVADAVEVQVQVPSFTKTN